MPIDLKSLLGGGGAEGTGMESLLGGQGLSGKEASVLSLLEAMKSIGEAGTRRTASPIGSIAQTLIPLFAAPIQARQMEQQSQLQSLLLRAQIVKALSGGRGGAAAKSPEELDLMKARAEEARAGAEQKRAPFGGKSPTEIQLLMGKQAGDPLATSLYDMKQAEDMAQRTQESQIIEDRQHSLLDARTAEAERKRLAGRLPTNQVYVDPSSGERLPFKTVGDLEGSGLAAKPMDARAAQKIPDIKNAYRELQVLRDVSKRVLYSPEPDEGLLGQIMGVKKKRFQTLLESQAGRADIRQFETTKKSAALALGRALTGTGRVPVAEFMAVDALDANRDTVQSADAILRNFEGYLGAYLGDLGLDPTVLQSPTERAVGLPAPGASAPNGSGGPVALDFDNATMRTAFENIKAQFPGMTPTEMAEYYSQRGDPGRQR